jgi:hypothetical protein
MAGGHSVTAQLDGEFVVLLFGVRRNHPWRPLQWLAVRRGIRAMLAELEDQRGAGLLGWESFGRNPRLIVQYWRSFAALSEWARERGGLHRQFWTRYVRDMVADGAVGVWHEAYLVEGGRYETVYTAMPPIGLARAGRVSPARGRLGTAHGRLRAGAEFGREVRE